MSRLEVHKFGGTSVAGARRLEGASGLAINAAKTTSLVVVTSAMAGVTDALVSAANHAHSGEREEAVAIVGEIRGRHLQTLEDMGLDFEEHRAMAAQVEAIALELRELVSAAVWIGELTPRSRDRILAIGEKLAVRFLAAAIKKQGVGAVALDADTFLETDGSFGESNPLSGVADRTIGAALRPVLDAGKIAVVTGFCGRGPDGATTTLGRGGSDYTATIIAGAMSADEVTIWTDVDGVFTADPRIVPGARTIPQLNYREAAEMSFYGAKVLHQRTMIPVASKRIPVRTRNTMDPDAAGTVVDGRFTPGSHPVKAVSAVRGQCLVSVEGKGMAGVPGVAARVFGALAAKQISVTMISQSSSESSICLAVPQDLASETEMALKRGLQGELASGAIEEIVMRRDVGLIAAVGLGMAHTPGVASRVFTALASQGVSVLAIAQGSSELNITMALEESDLDRGVRAIHGIFLLHRIDTGEERPDAIDLMLVGCGNVGKALVNLVLDRSAHVFERFGVKPRIVAIADRSGYALRPTGMDLEELRALFAAKRDGRSLVESGGQAGDAKAMVTHALSYRLNRPVLVDVSDADTGADAFLEALELGADVVSANKKPLAGDLQTFTSLMETARRRRQVIKLEATVGAGLPVVDTLETLVGTGDVLRRAEGCLSGTLAFVMDQVGKGVALSAAVRDAVGRGYTEPDPAVDLSGADVARKAIILGRISGLVTSDIEVGLEAVVPGVTVGLPREELYARLEAYDTELANRVAEAKAKGTVLRYVATVGPNRIEVGPVEVAQGSALANLEGTDNMVVFVSDRYADRPLVVTGPGAGVDVTAMGVLGDIFRVAAERR